MGTRSRIVLDQRPHNFAQPHDSNPWTSDFISMYCHYDGYVEYTGKMLLEHYGTKKRAKDLIMMTLGYASALYETPEVTRERSVKHEDTSTFSKSTSGIFQKDVVLNATTDIKDHFIIIGLISKN